MLVSLCFFVDDRHLRGIAPGVWQKCANTIQRVTGLEGGAKRLRSDDPSPSPD
jgi:hypothetical protein